METHFCKAGLRYSIKVVLQVAVFERLMCRAVALTSLAISLAQVALWCLFRVKDGEVWKKVSLWVMF